MRKLSLVSFLRHSLVAAALFAVVAPQYVHAQREGGGARPPRGERPAQPELPKVELQGEDKFNATSKPLVEGLYQVAYSPKNNALYVTSSVGRQAYPTSLVKVDPASLDVTAKAELKRVPDTDEGVVNAVYGIGLDDTNGNVWVTNTRTATIAAYKQSDLSLVKQFDKGFVNHPRDIIVDEKNGKVYVSGRDPFLAVIDAKTLEPAGKVELKTNSTEENAAFMPMSLVIDEAAGKLYTIGMNTSEVAVVDLASQKVDKIFVLPNAGRPSGVAFDSVNKKILVANQGTGNLLIVNPETGAVEHDVFVGAGALNVSFEPVSKLAYVACFRAGTVAVVNEKGELVGNLDVGTSPNHLKEDGKGNVFVVNKSRGEDDPKGNRITRLIAK